MGISLSCSWFTKVSQYFTPENSLHVLINNFKIDSIKNFNRMICGNDNCILD